MINSHGEMKRVHKSRQEIDRMNKMFRMRKRDASLPDLSGSLNLDNPVHPV
jgi:hypothetical protein